MKNSKTNDRLFAGMVTKNKFLLFFRVEIVGCFIIECTNFGSRRVYLHRIGECERATARMVNTANFE